MSMEDYIARIDKEIQPSKRQAYSQALKSNNSTPRNDNECTVTKKLEAMKLINKHKHTLPHVL